MKTVLACFALCACAASLAGDAAPIPPDARVKADAVHALKIDFYDFPHWVPKGIDSLDDAKNFVGTTKPAGSFTVEARSVSFPPDSAGTSQCDKTTLGAYLYGADAFDKMLKNAAEKKTVVAERLKAPINSRSVFVYSGFIKVEKAGTYTIKMPVDDGDELTIGGVVVHTKTTFGGMTNPEDPAYLSQVTFVEPGIYPLKVLHWDREQELGIHLYCDMDAKGETLEKRVLLPVLPTPAKPTKK